MAGILLGVSHGAELSGDSWYQDTFCKPRRWCPGVFFVDTGEASSLAEGFLWAPPLVIKATLAAAGFTEQIRSAPPGRGLHEFWALPALKIKMWFATTEGSKLAIAVYCGMEKGPRLKLLQEELSYSVRALLDIYRYWCSVIADPLLLSSTSLFFPHFLASSNTLCLWSCLRVSICCTPLNIALFQCKYFTKFLKYQK